MGQLVYLWIVLLLLLLVTNESVCQGTLKYSSVVEVGRNETFNCTISVHVNMTIWLFRRRGQENSPSIVQGKDVFNSDQHALLLYNDTMLVLKVLNAEEEDDGTYFCQQNGQTTSQFDLVVEVPPIVYLRNRDETVGNSLDVVFKEESSIQCVANGSKPLVSLSWEVNGKKETGVITVDDSQRAERIIVSTLQYIPNIEDKTLTCVTGGQQAVQSKKVDVSVNVMYEPNCNLLFTNESTNEFRLVCQCEANPAPRNYRIYVNGSLLVSEKEALISSQYAARANCSATNTIGTDTSDMVDLTPFIVEQPLSNSYVALIVCLAVVVPFAIVIAVIVVYCREKRKKADNRAFEGGAKFKKVDNQLDLNRKTEKAAAKPLPPEEESETLLNQAPVKKPDDSKPEVINAADVPLPPDEDDALIEHQESRAMIEPEPLPPEETVKIGKELEKKGDKDL